MTENLQFNDQSPSRQKTLVSFVRDPIHGMTELEDFIIPFEQCKEFQRLRMIKQLSMVFFVYPGAMHTRYDHSVGTYAVMKAVLDNIYSEQDLNLPDVRKELKLAALLHDIGSFNICFTLKAMDLFPTLGRNIFTMEHETISNAVIDYIVRNNNDVRNAISTHGIDISLVKEFIMGTPANRLLSNQLSGLDVDKWDYLGRDSFYTGIGTAGGIQLERLINACRVRLVKLPNESEASWHLCFKESDAVSLSRCLTLREDMHLLIYRHKKVIEYEELLCRWMDEYYGNKYRDLSLNAFENPNEDCEIEKFLGLTDCTFNLGDFMSYQSLALQFMDELFIHDGTSTTRMYPPRRSVAVAPEIIKELFDCSWITELYDHLSKELNLPNVSSSILITPSKFKSSSTSTDPIIPFFDSSDTSCTGTYLQQRLVRTMKVTIYAEKDKHQMIEKKDAIMAVLKLWFETRRRQ